MASSESNPVLRQDVVLALVRRYVPTAQRVTAVDESGRKGRAYFIDDKIVLKAYRPFRLRPRTVEEFQTSLQKEAFFLDQMGLHSNIKTPRLLGYGREASTEYVCMTRMQGVSVRQANLSPMHRQLVLRDLSATLLRIHSLPQAAFIESGLFQNG